LMALCITYNPSSLLPITIDNEGRIRLMRTTRGLSSFGFSNFSVEWWRGLSRLNVFEHMAGTIPKEFNHNETKRGDDIQ
jgi:hypothetical protein